MARRMHPGGTRQRDSDERCQPRRLPRGLERIGVEVAGNGCSRASHRLPGNRLQVEPVGRVGAEVLPRLRGHCFCAVARATRHGETADRVLHPQSRQRRPL
ncbi:hypothetical protein D3C81_1866030 [compost metagenome]